MIVIKNVKKFVTKKASFPIFLNFLILAGAALLQGEIGSSIILLSFIAVILQTTIPISKKPALNLVGLELMGSRGELHASKWIKKIPYFLILTPAIASISVSIGCFYVLLGYVFSLKYFYDIFFRFLKKKELYENALEKTTEKNYAVVVYVSGMRKVAYQINQWIPVLEDLDQNVFIMVRERSVYHGMVATTLPVVFARTMLDVEKCFDYCENLKVALYPANTMKNVQALRHYRLQHCFINHGESDKAVNQSKFLMAYDKLFVGGQLAEDRLIDSGLPLRNNQIVHVGRPQAEILLDVKSKAKEVKKILYAPTWEGFVESVNYSSINNLGWSILIELSRSNEYEVFFKPHPYTGTKNEVTASYLKKMKNICSKTNIKLVDPLDSIHDCMNNSDLLITDISSVMNEYLVTKKPIIVCNVSGQDDKELQSTFPTCAAAYSISTEDNILGTLDQIKNHDRLDTVREKIKSHSLGDFSDGALNRFKHEIKKLTLQ